MVGFSFFLSFWCGGWGAEGVVGVVWRDIFAKRDVQNMNTNQGNFEKFDGVSLEDCEA